MALKRAPNASTTKRPSLKKSSSASLPFNGHFIAQKLLSGRGMGASKYKYSTGALIAHTQFSCRARRTFRESALGALPRPFFLICRAGC